MPDRWNPDFIHTHPALSPLACAAGWAVDVSDFPPVHTWPAESPLQSGSGAPLRFVSHTPRPRRRARTATEDLYEIRIYERGEVPSRERCWHDWLNFLVWSTYPRAKAALNRRQNTAIRAHLGARDPSAPLPGARSEEMDTLAMLDEGGALLLLLPGAPELGRLLDTDDPELLLPLSQAGAIRLLLFGHGAMAQLLGGEVGLRCLVLPLQVTALTPAEADRACAVALDAGALQRRPKHRGLRLVPALFA